MKLLPRSASCLFVLLCAAMPVRAQQKVPPPGLTPALQTGGEIAAQAAANVWLALLDDGQFERSYDAAAAITHNLVTKEQWTKFMTEHRPLLGKVLGRVSKSSRYTPALQGAPPGQYVVVECTTTFEHRKDATETITAALDLDGQWKVAGYFVK